MRTDAAVSEQSAEAPEVEAEGEILHGVETALDPSGGQPAQLRYVVLRGSP